MNEAILSFLQAEFSQFLIPNREIQTNLFFITLKKEGILPVCKALKEHPNFSFSFLNDLTSVDWLGKRSPRFEVLYLLKSPKSGHNRIQIRVPIEEGEEVPSIVSVYPGANWPEREVFDLMGITFSSHPRMERLIMPDNFVGHPLRKDYPLEGPGQDYLIQDLLSIHVNEDIEKD
ncbi:NADH dehydrogenase subunit C [Leptospira ryugenii]|uniref:NADH-quinone oxidoreductase subunit C n=1 Tax=Leptospira ryugenii TaxID=1917863 RepID=A0A2P2DYB1_9LEPT|nr:NADH-quinone oxidoreductase subunit C [Leptospira ryugenii]GBF49619.1 NADH dehydrogenase subunit C [Leptospira ryugenii]